MQDVFGNDYARHTNFFAKSFNTYDRHFEKYPNTTNDWVNTYERN